MKPRWLYCLQKAVSTDIVIALRQKKQKGLMQADRFKFPHRVTLEERTDDFTEEITATVDPTIFASIMEKQVSLFGVICNQCSALPMIRTLLLTW